MAVEHTYTVAGEEKTRALSRTLAIKEYCKDCCGGQFSEVKLCPAKTCPLWPYRTGKVDESFGVKKKEMSEENKKKAAERMKRLHKKGKLKRK